MATLNYYYYNGSSYFSDAAHTLPVAAPSTVYPDFADAGNEWSGGNLSWAVLSNSQYHVGIILTWGGIVGYMTDATGVNLVSSHDFGREFQPSWWAHPISGDPAGMENNAWNACQGLAPSIDTITFDGTMLYLKVVPYLWGFGPEWSSSLVPTTSYTEQWFSFDETNNAVIATYSFTYTGSTPRVGFWFEAPAIYTPSGVFDHFTGYRGSNPWTGASLTSATPTTDQVFYTDLSEGWAAAVNDVGYGVGALVIPVSNLYPINWLQCLQYNDSYHDFVFEARLTSAPGQSITNMAAELGNADPGTENLSAMATLPLTPGQTYVCQTIFTSGNITDIRARFYAIHAAEISGSINSSGSFSM
jgi:hypothetical protein